MKDNIRHEEICKEIAERFSISFEQARKLLKMVNGLAQKVNNNGYQGDLENIGWVAALKTLETADLSKGASPATCCYLPVKKAIIRAMKKEQFNKEHEELSENIIDNSRSQEEFFVKQEQIKFLIESMEKLPRDVREILELRLGFGNDKELTLKGIGDMFAISKQRIQQIEHNGIESLRGLFKEEGWL